MQSAHTKLFPAILKHMKSIEEYNLSIKALEGKPLRYLALYNAFSRIDEIKKFNVRYDPDTFEFAGAELFEIDYRMTGLREISFTAPTKKFEGDSFNSFLKSIALKNIEKIHLNFV